MTRNYIKKYADRQIDYDNLVKAIKLVKIENKSGRSVASSYGISQTSLSRYVKKVSLQFPDFSTVTDDQLKNYLKEITHQAGKTLFTKNQELGLLDYIIEFSKLNYGLTISNIRCLAYEYAQKCAIHHPDSWNKDEKASKDWYYSFMKRHPNLLLQKTELTSVYQAKNFSKLTSICNVCKRTFYLKSNEMCRSFFTCTNCDTDLDLKNNIIFLH